MIFTDTNTTAHINGQDSSAFEVQKAYFRYECSFYKELSDKIRLDVSDPGIDKQQVNAFYKTAILKYHKSNLSPNFHRRNPKQDGAPFKSSAC